MGCQGHIGSSEPASSSQRLKIPGRTRSLVARFSTHNDCARCEAVSYCPHARSGRSFATSRNPVQDRALPGPHQSSARPGRAHAMSLVTMTDLAIRTREPGGARPRSALVAGSDNQAQDAASAVHQTLGLIVAYIPSEILVTYVAVLPPFKALQVPGTPASGLPSGYSWCCHPQSAGCFMRPSSGIGATPCLSTPSSGRTGRWSPRLSRMRYGPTRCRRRPSRLSLGIRQQSGQWHCSWSLCSSDCSRPCFSRPSPDPGRGRGVPQAPRSAQPQPDFDTGRRT